MKYALLRKPDKYLQDVDLFLPLFRYTHFRLVSYAVVGPMSVVGKFWGVGGHCRYKK